MNSRPASVENNAFASQQSAEFVFDGSFSPPFWWKTIDDPKWGFRLQVPRSLQEESFEGKNRWVRGNDDMRVVVDFGKPPSVEELGRKKNYHGSVLQVNGLKALICTYEETSAANNRGMNKVAALIFLEHRRAVGRDEPFYRVEYKAAEDYATAVQILQTVRFYES